MNTLTLDVEARGYASKNELARRRKKGLIPAVLYGKHMDTNIDFYFDARVFLKHLNSHGKSSLLSLKSVDKKLDGKSAIIKDIQKEAVTNTFVHVDFIEVTQGEKLHTTISFDFVGTPLGVKEGGVIDIQKRELNIECFPQDIPECIEIDISKMLLNDVIHVSDLILPAGVEAIDEDDQAIVSLKVVREKVVSEEEAGAEPVVLTEAAAAERAASGSVKTDKSKSKE